MAGGGFEAKFDVVYWKRWQQNSKGLKQARPPNKREEEDARRSGKVKRKNDGAKTKNIHGRAVVFGKERQRGSLPTCNSCDATAIFHQRKAPFETAGGAIGLASKLGTQSVSSGPGPGEYHHAGTFGSIGKQKASEKKSSPAFPFSHGRRWNHDADTGGTTSYDEGKGFAYLFKQTAAPKFGHKATIQRERASCTPGPGQYWSQEACSALKTTVSASLGPPKGVSAYSSIAATMKAWEQSEQAQPRVTSLGFGHTCNRREHVVFGQCVDSQCSTRGSWETSNVGATAHNHGRALAIQTLLSLDCIDKDREETLQVLRELSLTEQDSEGKNVFHSLGEAEFEPQDLQVYKAQLAIQAAYETNQLLGLNDLDSKGRSPLHLAVETGQEGLVEVFLRHGADPLLRNADGKSSIDLSTRLFKNQGIFQKLKSKEMMDQLDHEIIKITNATI